MLQIPKSQNSYSGPVWNQTNTSDTLGSLWTTFNCDPFENDGKMRLGRRLVANTNTSDQSTLINYPIGFKQFSDGNGNNLWTVAGNRVFHQGNTYPNGGGFVLDTTTSSPTTVDSKYSDIEYFPGANTTGTLFVSGTSTAGLAFVYSGASWADASSGFSTIGGPGSLLYFPVTNRLYGNSGTFINSMNTSLSYAGSGTYTASLPFVNLQITFMIASNTTIWIGTVDNTGGKGYVFEWNGIDSQLSVPHILKSSGALAGYIMDEVPYIMDTNGVLLAFNGQVFQPLPNGALYRKNKIQLFNALSISNNRFIHPRGMTIVNGVLTMAIDGRNNDNSTASLCSIEETIPSGIWQYDPIKGLIHIGSFTQTHSGDSIQDYGAVKIAGVGAITELNIPNTTTGRNGTFLAGASYFSDASTVKAGVYYDDSNDSLQKGGYFITTKLPATDTQGNSGLQNNWQNLYVLYRKLIDSGDIISTKYRVWETAAVVAQITWVTTTSFTVLNSAVNISNYWTAGTGGEVEILCGTGAGKCSHITNAALSTGTWTVTVDETYINASGTAQARFQNWTKIGEILPNNSIVQGVTYDQQGVGTVSNWIQFKVSMIFKGKDEIEKLLVANGQFNLPD